MSDIIKDIYEWVNSQNNIQKNAIDFQNSHSMYLSDYNLHRNHLKSLYTIYIFNIAALIIAFSINTPPLAGLM